MRRLILLMIVMVGTAVPVHGQEVQPMRVGNLADMSGRTSVSGRDYAQGKLDALTWINANGGVLGRPMEALTADYAYITPRAIESYDYWQEQGGVLAVLGWGRADTEALRDRIERDHIPYFSAHYSAAYTVPDSSAPGEARAAPFHFFVAPSYSDMARGLVRWAQRDWSARRRDGSPVFLQIGRESEFSAGIRRAGAALASELKFRVLVDILLRPGDDPASVCPAIAERDPDYILLTLDAVSHLDIAAACRDTLTDIQLMTHVWGFDRNLLPIGGAALDGIVWTPGSAVWGEDVRGMKRLRAVSSVSDKDGKIFRSSHYIRGVCSVFYLKEAMETGLDDSGTIDGTDIRDAMYVRTNWVPEGLEGVCPPASWKPDDHRGVMDVRIYRAHINVDVLAMELLATIQLPRRSDWKGW